MVNKFLANALDKPLQYLHLGCEKYTDISNFNIGIRSITSLTKFQVYIKRFNIDGLNLKEILECSSDAENIIFYDCHIGSLEGFELNDAIDYNTKVLDLYMTCNSKDNNKLNNQKIIAFVEALAKTNLKDSLERIHVRDSDYYINDLANIFKKFKFNATICGDEHWPKSKDHVHETMDLNLS